MRSTLGDSLALDSSRGSDACFDAGERLLEAVLEAGCSSRETARDLLTADALVTYAFEAAAQSPAALAARASGAMTRLAALAAARPDRAP